MQLFDSYFSLISIPVIPYRRLVLNGIDIAEGRLFVFQCDILMNLISIFISKSNQYINIRVYKL